MPYPLLLCAEAFIVSAAATYLIVQSGSWHLSFTADPPGAKPQKFHTRPVPRIGGVGVFLGMLATGGLAPLTSAQFQLYWLLILSLLPAFCGGFAEDVTHRIGAGARLLLTVITAAFAFTLAGVHFERSDVEWLNEALAFLPFGYLALLFAVAGVAHSMNIIDGYNGLAAGVATIILGALGYVALGQQDTLVATFAFGCAASTVGFLWFNYPSGRVFLGDCGAYLLGCVVALASALLILRNPAVSPWFPLALVIYPVWETLFSAGRRLVLLRRISEPDARHLHSLVYRRLSRRWVRGRRKGDKVWRNSMTTLPFWAANLVLAVAAVYWMRSTAMQQILILLFVLGYCVAYWKLPHPRVARRASRMVSAPARQGSGPEGG